MNIISAKELLEMNIESVPCLVEPIFPKVGLVAMAGSSDTGKSTLMRQLCINIASGNDSFLDYKINATHKKALYVSTEDGKQAVASLLLKQNSGLNLPEEKFTDFKYVFNTEALLTSLEQEFESCKYDIIVIDAFSDIFSKDINQTGQVRTFLNDYSEFAEKEECLIVFIHHTGKASENKKPSKNNVLGSQGFEAKMRTVAMLVKNQTKPKIRHFCIVKGNYLPDGYKNEAAELLFDENMLFTKTGNTELFENLSIDDSKRQVTEKIIELHTQGKKQSEIAKDLSISQPTVSKTISSYKSNTSL